MGAFAVVQDWITLQGLNATDEVVQPQESYVDALRHPDVITYIQVRDYAGTARILIQTCPSLDEGLWSTMVSYTPTSTGTQTDIIRFASASDPLSRYVRWKVDASSANWKVVFRILAVFKSD